MRPISHKAIRYLVGPGSSSLVRSRSVSFATLFRCQGWKNGRVDGPTKTHRKVSCPRTILFSPPALPASESEDNFSKLFIYLLIGRGSVTRFTSSCLLRWRYFWVMRKCVPLRRRGQTRAVAQQKSARFPHFLTHKFILLSTLVLHAHPQLFPPALLRIQSTWRWLSKKVLQLSIRVDG